MKTENVKLLLLAAVIAVALPEAAFSQDLGKSVETAGKQITNIPSLVSGFAYILGAVLVMAGALSLKKHSETPASEPMAKGVGRLLAGAAIISLPALAGFIQKSVNYGTNTVQVKALDPLPF